MWPWAFDHHLDVVFPRLLGEFAESFQLRELRRIAGVGQAAGAQSVAQRKADIVLLENLADVFEALVEHVLLVVLHHPLGQNGAAAAHDAGDALRRERNILHQHAGVNGHIVHALLGLLFDDFEHDVAGQIFHAPHARERFIDGHGADGYGRIGDDGSANGGNVAAGGEIHHGIGAVLHRVAEFFQLAFDIGGHGRVADIRVDLALRRDADGHRLEIRVVDIGRNDHAAARYFIAHQFRRELVAHALMRAAFTLSRNLADRRSV
jgi:hypothetical protein